MVRKRTLFQRQLLTVLISLIAGIVLTPKVAEGQIVPDESLGEESSTIRQDNVKGIDSDIIEGGATRGGNLFHSFTDFNVDAGRGAYFANPDTIDNILSRVTGSNISEIMGTLGVLGDANLFLINPNGIVFGENARLDVNGSFFASTADSLLFENGFEFSGSNPEVPPLLTVNIPVGLGFRDNPGSIENRSIANKNKGLEVLSGQNLTLLGGDINFERGQATARGGNIELGGLSALGTVGISDDSSLNFPEDVAQADITLSNAADVDVRGTGGGSITINARNLNLEASSLIRAGITPGSTFADAQAGDITINATEKITVDDSDIANRVNFGAVGDAGNIDITARSISLSDSSVYSRVARNASGQGGQVTITTNSLTLSEGSSIYTTTFGKTGENGRSNAGSIEINISNSLEATDASFLNTLTAGEGDAGKININGEGATISFDGIDNDESTRNINTVVAPDGVGQGGDIFITAKSFNLINGALITSETTGQGDAGSINITATSSVNLINEAVITSSTFGEGNAGSIIINAVDTVFLDNASNAKSRVVETEATGNGGNINIQTRTLSLANGSEILADTFGKGKAGSIQVDVSDSVILSGVAPFPKLGDGNPGGFSSGLITSTEKNAKGQGGSISVHTDHLQVSDGAVLSARSQSDFKGGNITVDANTLEVTGGGQILTTAFSNGNAGNINLSISDRISLSGSDPTFFDRLNQVTEAFEESVAIARIDPVSPESGIFANTKSDSMGNGGSVNVQTGNFSLDSGAKFAVNSEGTGNGGSIKLSADNLSLNNNSEISAATTSREGGNINLDISKDIFFKNNSLISASASGNANGGNITINAEDGLIVAFPNQNNDIIANADKGNGGNINITTQAIFGLEERPENPFTNDIDASSQFGLQGTFSLNTPEIDPSQGVVELPVKVQDPNQLIAQDACKLGKESSLVVTGRGGLPPSSSQDFNSNWVDVDLIQPIFPEEQSPLGSNQEVNSVSSPDAASQNQRIPAEGWVVNEKGEVFLVAYKSGNDNSQRQHNRNYCQPK